jgi:hypothetical protein
VIPAKRFENEHAPESRDLKKRWIPAFAGMTNKNFESRLEVIVGMSASPQRTC